MEKLFRNPISLIARLGTRGKPHDPVLPRTPCIMAQVWLHPRTSVPMRSHTMYHKSMFALTTTTSWILKPWPCLPFPTITYNSQGIAPLWAFKSFVDLFLFFPRTRIPYGNPNDQIFHPLTSSSPHSSHPQGGHSPFFHPVILRQYHLHL